MREPRPIPLLVAVVSLSLLGVGAAVGVPLLLWSASAAQQLDDHLGALGGGILVLAAAVVAVVGVAALVGAVGVWRGRSWGWLAGALVTGVVAVGTLIVVATSSSEPPLLAGMLVAAVGAAALWLPVTRRACGI